MKNLVIVSFPAKEGMLEDLKETLKLLYQTQDHLMDVYQLILILRIQQIQFI